MSTLTLVGAPEDLPFAIAPLGDAWTVVNPDATERIAPVQTWSRAMADLVAVALTHGLGTPGQFRWVGCS
jgi:hypothetical protein